MNVLNKREKAILIVMAVFVAVVIFCSFLFAGCQSQGLVNDGTILKYQQQVDRLEEELRNRDRAVENAIRELGAITSRSEGMEGTVDELIELFTEYQQRVDKLLYEYDRIRAQTEE